MNLKSIIPQVFINYFWHLPIAILANLKYSFPSKNLIVLGVTGTDGKTTTATMLYHILKKAGKKVALISTVEAKIGRQGFDTGFHVTTPDPFPLQKMIKKIVNEKIDYLVLETTSHGFDQFRLWGINFFGGIVTNITEDHLDYHKTWQKYALAKSLLFQNTKLAVLNIDDKSYRFLKSRVSGKIITYGIKFGDFNLTNFPLKLKVIGEYNKLNALAASALASNFDIDNETIKKALESFFGVSGRMEIIQDKPFKLIVDFAHTPNALLTALTSLKKLKHNRIISVFGCAGLRDRNRRKMGKVSAQNANITIITAEDPRTEGVEKISKEIADWAEKGRAINFTSRQSELSLPRNNKVSESYPKSPIYIKIPDRQDAISFAVKIAKPNDIVGIFGKGHERSMCYGKKELPWSDQNSCKKALKNK